MSIATDILDKYYLLVFEYLHVMNTAPEQMKQLDNMYLVVQHGLFAITHIYVVSVHITKSVATAICNSQKGIYCYLEYVDQMTKANIMTGGMGSILDTTDAIQFIYDKTITEIYGMSATNTSFSNMISMTDTSAIGAEGVANIIDKLPALCSTLFWFQNTDLTTEDRMVILETEFRKYANLCVEYPYEYLLDYIATIQDKLVITKTEYMAILAQFHKVCKRLVKTGAIPTRAHTETACLYSRVLFQGRTLEQVAAEECWKTPVDDLVKYAFLQYCV